MSRVLCGREPRHPAHRGLSLHGPGVSVPSTHSRDPAPPNPSSPCLPQAPGPTGAAGSMARQEVMSGGPMWSGHTPVARTCHRARWAGAGPGGYTSGGDFLPRLLSSVFQRSHRTPSRQEGCTAQVGDLGWGLSWCCSPGWVTRGWLIRGGCPRVEVAGWVMGWLTRGGVSPGAVPGRRKARAWGP